MSLISRIFGPALPPPPPALAPRASDSQTPALPPNMAGPVLRACVLADTDVPAHLLPVEPVDVLLCLGDLSDECILACAERLGNPPIVAVRGNHDAHWDFPQPIHNAHQRTITLHGVSFYGFGGSPAYKANLKHSFSDEEVREALRNVSPVDVFLAHNSPLGIHDREDRAHRGFAAFREYIDRASPRFFLHGHMHVDKITQVGKTQVIGTYGYRFLRFPLQ